MAKTTSPTSKLKKPKVTRPGVHSKCNTSKNKKSRNYKKSYRGQGR